MGSYRARPAVRLARRRRRGPRLGLPDRLRFLGAVRAPVHGGGRRTAACRGRSLSVGHLPGPRCLARCRCQPAGAGRPHVLHGGGCRRGRPRSSSPRALWLAPGLQGPRHPGRSVPYLVRSRRPFRAQGDGGLFRPVGVLEDPYLCRFQPGRRCWQDRRLGQWRACAGHSRAGLGALALSACRWPLQEALRGTRRGCSRRRLLCPRSRRA